MDRTFDRSAVGAFLRARRTALQPEDVGLRRGQRRRAPGLRREEVADLCTMSADYFARLERGDGPQPSEHMVAAIARGLRLTPDERDHLFLIAGYHTNDRDLRPNATGLHTSSGKTELFDLLRGTHWTLLVYENDGRLWLADHPSDQLHVYASGPAPTTRSTPRDRSAAGSTHSQVRCSSCARMGIWSRGCTRRKNARAG